MHEQMAEAFRRQYEEEDSSWGRQSGAGSDPYYTIEYRAVLDKFIRANGIRSIVDLGCGDWQFTRYLNLNGLVYHGYDVVESVVARNRKAFGTGTVSFSLVPEKLEDIAGADLLIMKDVLQHLPDREIFRHRDELFGRFRYCLLTNSYRKLDAPFNIDIEAGNFRCLDLTLPPYDVAGAYILEFGSPLWERLRTLLVINPSAVR